MKLSKEKRSGRAKKGSRLHLQNAVNDHQTRFNVLISAESQTLTDAITGQIDWVSPLKDKDYLEYQDEEFLEAAGYSELEEELKDFWPEGGPVWDALGTFETRGHENGVILLEAKSHKNELSGGGCGAGGESKERISKAFDEVTRFIGVESGKDWMGRYYQYANRLAHLYFLSVIQKIPVWLVFVYFVDDKTIENPMRKQEWGKTIAEVKKTLGLGEQHALSDRTIEVFPKTEQFES